jgi:CelD/BcsL family acetyltransferase involved in cellulose biosynthesis
VTPRIEVVTDLEQVIAVEAAWQDLWQRAGGRIFQRYDWVTTWMVAMRERRDARPLVAFAWDGTTLVGVLAFAIHRRSRLRMLHWAAQLFSDYCDCLIDPAVPSGPLLTDLWNAIWRTGGFDVVNLQQVRPDAVCRPFLDGLIDGPLQAGERTERCMRIENQWENGEAFFRSLNKKGRNNHTRGKRILAELGGDVCFEVVEPGADIDPLIAEITRLKDVWLRATDPTSPLLDVDAPVLRAMLKGAWESGLARLFLLRSGGALVAASVNFVYANRMEAYFTCYDAAYERASPGTILIVEYTMWSFDRKLTLVDFLRGEEAFKFRMANAETVLDSYSGSKTLMGQIAVSGHRWLSRRRLARAEGAAAPVEELETAGSAAA